MPNQQCLQTAMRPNVRPMYPIHATVSNVDARENEYSEGGALRRKLLEHS